MPAHRRMDDSGSASCFDSEVSVVRGRNHRVGNRSWDFSLYCNVFPVYADLHLCGRAAVADNSLVRGQTTRVIDVKDYG